MTDSVERLWGRSQMRLRVDRKAIRALAGLGAFVALLGWLVLAATAVPGGVARASHATFPVGTLAASTQVTLCHTEGNATQHQITVAAAAVISAGHFDASGNPLHQADGVHDFIVSIEGVGVINAVVGGTCELVATPTATATSTGTPPTTTTTPVGTATATATATVTPTSTQGPPHLGAIIGAGPRATATPQPTKAAQQPSTAAPIQPPRTGDGGLVEQSRGLDAAVVALLLVSATSAGLAVTARRIR
jgi:hypothetical protein